MNADMKLLLRIQADMAQAVGELRDLRKDIGNVGTTGRRVAGEVSGIGHAAKATTSLLRSMRDQLVGLFAVHEVVRFGQALVGAQVEMQRIHYTLQSVTGSSSAAGREFKYVSDISDQLGLDLKSTAAGYARLAVSAKSAGITTQQMHEAFRGLADTFTVLHTPTQDVNGLLIQLEQGMSLGRLQMQDFRAIAQHLPGTLELVGEAARRMGGNLQSMLQNGGVPAKQFFMQFTRLLREKYGPEAAQAAQSVNAQINRMHNAMFRLRLELGKGGFIDSVTASMRDLEKELEDPQLIDGLTHLVAFLGDIARLGVKAAGGVGMLVGYVDSLAQNAGRISAPRKSVQQLRTDVQGLTQDLKDLQAAQRAGVDASKNDVSGFPGMILHPELSHEQSVAQRILMEYGISGKPTAANIQKGIDKIRELRGAAKKRTEPQFPKTPWMLRPGAMPGMGWLLGYGPSALPGANGAGAGAGSGGSGPSAAEKILRQMDATSKLRQELSEIRKAYDQGKISETQYTEATSNLNKQLDNLRTTSGQTKDQLRQAVSPILDAIDPTRRYQRQLTKLDEAYAAHVIDANQYAEAHAHIVEEMKKVGQQSKKETHQINQFAVAAARQIQSGFANFLFDPFKHGLSGMVQDFANAMRQMVSQIMAQKILTDMLSRYKGSGGILGSFAHAIIPSANGNVFDHGQV
ncbi:MAG TPA: tape measure protein, partial [Gammaproteobacteria bacterium]|nr:tape measure protein [Gammaproteobacteria bacterium]